MFGSPGVESQAAPFVLSDGLVDSISRKVSQVVPDPPPSYSGISEEQRKRVFGDTPTGGKPPKHTTKPSARPSSAMTAREKPRMKASRSQGPTTPRAATPSSIIYQHEPPAAKKKGAASSPAVAKPVRKTNVDSMVERMDRFDNQPHCSALLTPTPTAL